MLAILMGLSLLWAISVYVKVSRIASGRIGAGGRVKVSQQNAALVKLVDKFCNRFSEPLGRKAASWVDNLAEKHPERILPTAFVFTMFGYLSVFLLAWLSAAIPLVAVVMLCSTSVDRLLLRSDLASQRATEEKARLYVALASIIGMLTVARFVLLLVLPARSNGIDLMRYEAPKLFALLDELKPEHKLEKIYIDASYNMYVQSTAGLFGRKRGVLVLGYPALLTLSLPQVRAVIAHELGHMQESHLLVKEWVLRSRAIWILKMDYWRKYNVLVYAFMKVAFGWYIPPFTALSFAVKRQGEYEADDFAAARISAKDYACALMSLSVKQIMFRTELQSALKELLAQGQPTAASNIYTPLAQKLNMPSDATAADAWAQVTRLEKNELATHPALLQRLARLGFIQEVTETAWSSQWMSYLQINKPAGAAGQELLAERLERLGEKLTAVWSKQQMSAEVNRTVSYMQRAAAHFNSGRYKEAVNDCSEALTLDASRADGYTVRASAYAALGQYAESLEDANRLIDLKPEESIGYFHRALAEVQMGKLADAVADATKAIDLSGPADVVHNAYLTRAGAYLRLEEYTQALEDCGRARELKPQSFASYITQATVYTKQGKREEAIKACTQGLVLAPENATLLRMRAAMQLCCGRLDEALSDTNQLIEMHGGHERTQLLHRANIYLLKGDLAQALHECNAVVSAHPHWERGYELRARINREMGNRKGAIADMSTAIEKTPVNSTFRVHRANLLIEDGATELAMTDYQEAVKSKLPGVGDYFQRAYAGAKLAQYDQSRRDLAEALAKGEPGPFEHNLHGKVLSALEQRADALAAFDRAIAIAAYPRFLFNRAGEYLELDKLDSALADLNDAIQKRPDNAEFYERRAEVYSRMGETDLAKEDLDRVEEKRSICSPNGRESVV